ncbi:L-2-amino-thiazoline-4-carboxylic acid hydrolase [Pollutibacter soli]|uniref:L-2-amino-thiazoline-4-carboxylic acid hydrolase n=1 Tax=Pollutibacter soli TaxID=3034157 RepID=UPI003013995C
MHDYRPYFYDEINKVYPGMASAIIQATDDQYTTLLPDISFISYSGNPIDKRLDFSAYFLALIQVLEKEGEDFEKIRMVCLNITTEYVKPKSALQRWFKKWPSKIMNTKFASWFYQQFEKRISVNKSSEGFIAKVITDKDETYGMGFGIDILECGICKLFNKHNSRRYASILCEVDEITSAQAGLKLIRTGTIANGAHKCDFRYKKSEKYM